MGPTLGSPGGISSSFVTWLPEIVTDGTPGSHRRTGGATTDITARVAVESEAAHVRGVLDATRDAVFMFDRNSLRFTYVNQGATAVVELAGPSGTSSGIRS